MKIYLISPGRFATGAPPLNLGYLTSYIKKYDKEEHEIKIINESIGDNAEEEILKFNPNVRFLLQNLQSIFHSFSQFSSS